MNNQNEKILFRIRDKATGLYSDCQESVAFNKLGKLWFSIFALKKYLDSLDTSVFDGVYASCFIELCYIKPCDFININHIDFKDVIDV